MRMLTKSRTIPVFNFGSIFQGNLNVYNNRKIGNKLTEEELKDYIKNLPKPWYCNEVMGVSCGDGGAPTYDPSVTPWNLLSPFDRWDLSGGMCPAKDGEVVIKRSYCSSGCADFFGKCKSSNF